MEKNFKKILWMMIVLLPLAGCKDVIEEDISNKSISINSPAEGAKSTIYKQLFWWNKLEGATHYSIQIATPTFDSVVSILADTLVVGADKYYKTLAPGKYQWRIRAENGSYKTSYQTYNLTMLQASLGEQTLSLLTPVNNTYYGSTSSGVVNFTWEAVPGATKYLIQIDTVTGNFGTSLLLEEEITENTFTYTFTGQGDYKWRVKAMDDGGNSTAWPSARYTGYYSTPPTKPNPVSPANNSNITGTSFTLSWSTVSRAKMYTLSIYRDNGSTPVDTTAESSENYSITAPTTSKSVSISASDSGDMIYWRVSATDKAGNKSTLSVPRGVNVQ